MRSFTAVLVLVILTQWSGASAQEVTIKQTKELKNVLALSADFKIFAEKVKTDKAYSLKIRETESGKEIKTLEWDNDWGAPSAASFSLDGKKLAILCGEFGDVKTAKVFDLASGEMNFNLRHPQLKFVAFTPDGKKLLSAGGYGASSPKETLWIWDVETRKKIETECPTTPTCIALSPDGKLGVAGHGKYGDLTPFVTTCEVATGKRVATVKREQKEEKEADVVTVTVSSDSMLIAAGRRDGTIKLYDVAKAKEMAAFADVQDEIFSVAFHPKENLLAATGKDKTIRFWNVENKKLVSTTKLPSLDYYLKLQFSTDGTQFATYTPRGNGIKVWSIEVKK